MHKHDEATDHAHEADHADDGKPRIAFIGAGRVGTALGMAFARAGWQVTAVASRDEDRRRGFQERVAGARAFADAHAVLDEADLIF
ncbi:MAG TPA: NAD(P)-binding domain-containing protein, partial [Candidatus Limnocylindrales bacterium]